MMRRLVWLVAIFAVIWGAWWMAASAGLQKALDIWAEDRRAAGWTVEFGEATQQGFPFSLHRKVRNITVAEPAKGLAIALPQLDLSAAAYWPGFIEVTLPDAPFTVITPAGKAVVQADDGHAAVRLHPGASLQLQRLSLVSGAWQIDADQSQGLSADSLMIDVTQDKNSAETYRIGIKAANLTPGPAIRADLSLPSDWPGSFAVLSGNMDVTFDRPWDRRALNGQQPQPRTIDIEQIQAEWGAIQVRTNGRLAIDPAGIPSGTISITVPNWRGLVDLAVAGGALPLARRQQTEFMLGMLANMGGNPDDMHLELAFENGEMSLGPIALGPAPRLFLP